MQGATSITRNGLTTIHIGTDRNQSPGICPVGDYKSSGPSDSWILRGGPTSAPPYEVSKYDHAFSGE